MTDLAVEQTALVFTLKALNNRDISLAVLHKKGSVVLVFYRSANW